MKRGRQILVIAGLLFPAAIATAAAQSEISGLLQSLHGVQDDIARGDLTAVTLQTELIDRLRDALESPLSQSKDAAEWETVAIGYALDGANPQIVRRLLATIGAKSKLHDLALAVSEYSIGNMKEAISAFETIDAKTLDPRLAPYVALAEGTAYLEIDAKKAVEKFERAVLLGSGTLVEEVAVRRLAILGLKSKDAGQFERAATLYVRRYNSSPFAGQFFAVLAKGGVAVLDDKKALKLADLVGIYLKGKHIPVLLNFAEQFAIKGKLDQVKYLSDIYFETSEIKNPPLADRLALYKILAAKEDTIDESRLNVVKAIDPNNLTKDEVVLWRKATDALETVLKPLIEHSENEKVAQVRELYTPKKPDAEAASEDGHTAPADAETGKVAPEGKVPPENQPVAQAETGDAAVNPASEQPKPAEASQPDAASAPPEPTAEAKAANAEGEPAAGEKPAPADPLMGDIEATTAKADDALKAVDAMLKDSKL